MLAMASRTSGNAARTLRILILAAAAMLCAADGVTHRHMGSGASLRGDSNMDHGTRGCSETFATSSLRSGSPEELMGEKAVVSFSEDAVVYPPPSAKGSSWRFELKHVAAASPVRGRGSSPRPSCARCHSVSDADSDEGMERVNLRMDFSV
mmetsp:Transcript_2355/g.4695  ORF Transcript_2355/g.4695 Transcript_2355/m.4695 type:complete len:151 (-) Transcript_2355:399-851(-)|eukprot:CAMPEP_0173393540 /NCGR_PEP_ID=MMETSP1356-20130122/22169_1 /TAXON_ID=77927 ORGANISM="Hemiselmis virescens, Strain PCC157" /NCGR_SAMPLE_ID=MMETSP1356 /ASSEMBLY_ACC=CAM_ASM_000847 /LENGTH=150 /DNA_ID=CAMNT_0014351579 /DNA_START=223 /DNA_END=675 /DNA_ORIENTATION=+